MKKLKSLVCQDFSFFVFQKTYAKRQYALCFVFTVLLQIVVYPCFLIRKEI